jgi:hypothetical protein
VGRFAPQGEGKHRATFDPGDGTAALHADFLVAPHATEMRRAQTNREELEALATTTGGQLVELADIATLVDVFEGEPERTTEHHEASLWDNWLTILFVVMVYSADVGMRRLRGLP